MKPEELDRDPMYDRAVGLLVQTDKASTAFLQRRLGLGYNAAARLMERAEADGIVSRPNDVGKRDVRISVARVAELEAENERLGDLFDDLCYFSTPEARRAHLAELARLRQGVQVKRVRHIKRGSTYQEVGRGQIQTGRLLSDYADVVIYQSEEDATFWVRPTEEFDDITRFEKIAALVSPGDGSFQDRVQPWMMACFGAEISADRLERGDRFLEEALELLQSGNYPKERVAALTDYVWSREVGDPPQEVGGVMVTLAAYCLAYGLDMHTCGETELAHISTPEMIEKIRAKQAAKPRGSALPVATPGDGWRDMKDGLVVRADDLMRRFQNKTQMKYAADCKCGECAIVPLADIAEVAEVLFGFITAQKYAQPASEGRAALVSPGDGWTPPPEDQRPEGYRCLALIEVEWTKVFKGGLYQWQRPVDQRIYRVEEGAPGTHGFLPLPAQPASEPSYAARIGGSIARYDDLSAGKKADMERSASEGGADHG